MTSETKRVELYFLLLQSSTALLIALVNASQTCRHDVQLAIKKRLLQLVRTLWEYLRDEVDELDSFADSGDDITLGPSRGFTDLSSAFQNSSARRDERHRPLTSTPVRKGPDTMHGTRFPFIQRLLTVLARTPNEDIFTRTVQPFVHEPNFQQRLQQEMEIFRRMLAEDDPSLFLDEPTLTERLDQMDLTMRRIMNRLDALAQLR